MGKNTNEKIIIITGPSSAGLSTVVAMLINSYPNFYAATETTSRARRPGEEDSNYLFVSTEEFEEGIKNDCYIYWDQYLGNYYGLHKDAVSRILAERKHVVLSARLGKDLNAVKKLYPDLISIFIIPQDIDSMVESLIARENNDMARIESRLNVYEAETYAALRTDAILVNKRPEETAQTIVKLVEDPECAKKHYDECVELVVQLKKALMEYKRIGLQAWLKKEKSRLDTCVLLQSTEDAEKTIAASISRSNSYIHQQFSGATQLIESETERLRGVFGTMWKKLLPATQTSLISAGVLWSSCSRIEDPNFDYSGICITTTCGFEAELKKYFYTDFQHFLKARYGDPSEDNDISKVPNILSIWPEELLEKKYHVYKKIMDDGGVPEIKLGNHFTMGTLPYLFYSKRSRTLREKMNEYLCTILKKPESVKGGWWAINMLDYMVDIKAGERDSNSFVSRCERVRDFYRNPAAHSGVVSRETALACSAAIVGKEAFSNAIVGRADAFAHNTEVQGLIMKLHEFLK